MCLLLEVLEKMCALLEYYKSNQINSNNTIVVSVVFHQIGADITILVSIADCIVGIL